MKQSQLTSTTYLPGRDIKIKPQGYKTFTEHEILIAHKYENIKQLSIFHAQLSLESYFSYS